MIQKPTCPGNLEETLRSIVTTADTLKTETNTSKKITSPNKEDLHRRFAIRDGKFVEIVEEDPEDDL